MNLLNVLFFRDETNQQNFLLKWRSLYKLEYKVSTSGIEEKREISKGAGERSLTLFIFKGDPKSLDEIHSHIQLREHDIIERYSIDELRGTMTHLRKIQPTEVEKIFDRLKKFSVYSKLKILLVPIHSKRNYSSDITSLLENTLEETTEGHVKTAFPLPTC